jgi:Arylsulfotransferase (ASST)
VTETDRGASTAMKSSSGSANKVSPAGGKTDAVFRAAFWTSLIVLAFVAGALVTLLEIFPGPEIARAYKGGKALYEKVVTRQDVFTTDLWRQERSPARGVTRYDAGRAQDGVTLYTSGHAPAAFLIAMDGKILHEWRKPFSEVWNPEAKDALPKTPQPDSFIYFRKAHAFPNGDLVAIYEAAGDTPYGYGVVKLDKNSNVIWTYLGAAHHDLDVGPDGRIYLLTQEIVQDEPVFGNLETPRLEDFLVILGPDGKEQAKLRLTNLVAKSPWRHLLNMVSAYATADPLHANTVKVIEAGEAKKFPYGKAGQVLVSFRELGAIGVVDIEKQKLVWAARGPWLGQHDPHILPNGNMLLFDNYGHFSDEEGFSRVIEFDPKTMEIVWSYGGTARAPLESAIRSWQQRLKNGNTLIVESDGGRVVEVTREGETVWEFVNPVRHQDDTKRLPMIPVIGWAERLDPTYLDPSVL